MERIALGFRRSNDKIEHTRRLVFQLSRPLTKIGDGDALGNFNDGFPNFLHNAANGATRLIRAGALLIKPLANAAYGSQRSLNMPHDCRNGDFLRTPSQPITSGNAASTLN